MMGWPKSSAALFSFPLFAMVPIFAALASLTGCTPEYTRQQSQALIGQARLLDSIDIERLNQRLLSRQEHVCLLSADAGHEAGAELLRTIQMGFSGYFVSVGVSGESIDYLRAVSSTPCPGASYLFYVQPLSDSACDNTQSCKDVATQFVITILSAGDQSLVDRIQFSIKKSFLPLTISERERQQKAFEQLAIALTGGK